MTYNQWFAKRRSISGDDARCIYVEIFGDVEGAANINGVIEFHSGYLMVTQAGEFDAICGRDQLLTRDLDAAARFLWDNHAKYEVAAAGVNIIR